MRATEVLEYYAGRAPGGRPLTHFYPPLYDLQTGLYKVKTVVENIQPVQPPAKRKQIAPIPIPGPAVVIRRQPKPQNAIAPLRLFQMIFGRSRQINHIAFGSWRDNRKKEFGPRALSLIPVKELQQWIPELLNYQIENTQVYINHTFSETAKFNNARETSIGKYAKTSWFSASDKYIEEMCAIVADLDVWQEDTDDRWRDNPTAAVGEVIRMSLAGEIPMPALLAYSGRGSYVLWLLREDDSEAPPLATKKNRHIWEMVSTALSRKLKHLNPDLGAAATLAKWYKGAGTIDYKTGNEVIYISISSSDIGNLPLLSLNTLQKQLQLYIDQIPESRPQAKPKSERGASKAAAAPWWKRVREIQKLNNYRGGFAKSQPSRKIAIWAYHSCLLAALRSQTEKNCPEYGRQTDKALQECIEMARTFRPPLSPREVQLQLKPPTGKRDFRPWSNRKLANAFGVTEEEAIANNFEMVLPEQMDQEKKARKRAEQLQQTADRTERENLIETLIRKGESNSRIAEQTGVNRSTIYRKRLKLREQLGQRNNNLFGNETVA